MLQEAYKRDIPLFGVEHHDDFRRTKISDNPAEHRQFSDVLTKGNYFLAIHIPQIRRCQNLPESIVIHMDMITTLRSHVLKQVQALPPDLMNQQRAPRSSVDLLNSGLNDLLLRNYFRDRFFGQFSTIVVTTLYCGFQKNHDQILKRDGRGLFFDIPGRSEELYNEVYRCWRHNLDVLSPAAKLLADVTTGSLRLTRAQTP